MNIEKKKEYCVGCHDNVYNHGCGGSNQCWSLDEAKLVWRKEVSIDQFPPFTQKARQFLNCYHRQRYVYYTKEQLTKAGYRQ